MSIEAMAICLNHSTASGAAKLVLLGIANHDGDGGAWPAVATLARYAHVSERNVRKALDTLEKAGEISRHTQQGGTATMQPWDRPNLYRILLECPRNCDRSKNHRLLCRACRKPLPGNRPDWTTHPDCAPLSVATGGVGSDTPALSVATVEPSMNQITTDIEETHVPERARVSAPQQSNEDASGDSHQPADASPELIIDACPKWRGSMPHSYARATGKCVDCGAVRPASTNGAAA